jgi:hypothetical protein
LTALDMDTSSLPSSMPAGPGCHWEWQRKVRPLVRAGFVSEIDLRCLFQRREIEDRPNLLALHVERPCSP